MSVDRVGEDELGARISESYESRTSNIFYLLLMVLCRYKIDFVICLLFLNQVTMMKMHQ